MPTWIMRDGRPIDMADMTDEHLENATRMVRAKLDWAKSKLDDLNAEYRVRLDDGWRLTSSSPRLRVWRRGPRKIALLSSGLGDGRYSLAWFGPRGLVLGRFKGPIAMVEACMAIDEACFGRRAQ